MDELKPLDEYPDISFIDHYTLTQLNADMLAWFREKKKELSGKDVVLSAGDDRRIILLTCAYYLYQGYVFIDDSGKMGLLKYARGEYLDQLGSMKKTPRNQAKGATTTLRFSIPEPRSFATGIPEGTRATAGNNLYFATSEYAEIPAGETFIDVSASCTTEGEEGNYLDIGEINTLVDSVPFISSVTNVTMPENGQGIEGDESYRNRIYLAPAGYSNAGSEDGYRYFVLSFNSNITDVKVTSPEECEVHIWYLLEDGRIPGEESLKALKEYLEEKDRKPITDRVVVKAPMQKAYDINLTYYINRSDSNRASVIQEQVGQAVKDYILWQSTKIGRDINPDELISRIKTAGAKRVELAAPAFTVVPDDSVASLGDDTVTYGGLEND
mgnify:FL=1